MNFLDIFLNRITMYRVVLYGLVALALWSLVVAASGRFAFGVSEGVLSLLLLVISCFGFNVLFSKFFRVTANIESWLITALILFFLFLPATNIREGLYLLLASLIAIGGKFVLAHHKDHWVNPAALAAVLLGFWPATSALWWVASEYLVLPMVVVGFLIVRKIRKIKVFGLFAMVAMAAGVLRGLELQQLIISWPLLFLGTVMLTEPLTFPRTKKWQYVYAVVVGGLFGSQINIGSIYVTPELALVLGNLVSAAVSDKQKYILKLKNLKRENETTYNFEFESDRVVKFRPGQYGEWTIGLKGKPDSRGNRRYFTIASAPGSRKVELGVKIFADSSQFKKSLKQLSDKDRMVLATIGGDFVIDNAKTKYVFMAGGIGITPFRSMVLDLLNRDVNLDVVLFYFNKPGEEVAYKKLFDKYFERYSRNIYYKDQRISEDDLRRLVKDWKLRTYYISGPSQMVEGYKKMLLKIGLNNSQIVTDYFPGF